ncbi:YedE family putative selenium transporter [Candidatus Margulisiibacteriota bacterium]
MNRIKNFFAGKWGIIVTGIIIGLAAIALQYFGNPKNMGFCIACFTRDIAGAIGLHRAGVAQYLRPEIIAIVLGSFLIAVLTREFKPRGGSSPIIRFLLGMFAIIGSLVFLGCPWRAILRLGGGDLNAIFGIGGLMAGIYLGTIFLKGGYDLGRSRKMKATAGLIFPGIMIGLLALIIVFPQVSGIIKSGILFYSTKGPGAMHAPVLISLAVGLIVGIIAQRSRFCTIGGFRDLFLFKQFHLISGAVSLLLTVFVLNLLLGTFNLGFEGQPVAHSSWAWNFLGMVLAGLAFALAGGCPGRQLVLAGEGDTDAAMFSLGMLTGAGVAHNFLLTASPKGIGAHSAFAVIFGLAVLVLIGFFNKEEV